MFEKEAEEYSNNWRINKKSDLNFAELIELRAVIYKAHKDGAEFGYSKGKADGLKAKINTTTISDAPLENEKRDCEIAELKAKVENLQKYLDAQNSYRECAETWQQLQQAKDLLKQVIRVTWGEGWSYSLGVKVEAEQFLKECENENL